MLEEFILGTIQGIAEWLPISSEGMIILAKNNLFPSDVTITEMIGHALFLHLGTFLAAAVYFHKDVALILKTAFNFKKAEPAQQKIFIFLFIATLISGIWGLSLLKIFSSLAEHFETKSALINLCVGILLIITGLLELRAKHGGYREATDLKIKDAILLGITQGCAALPGLSRSGLTVSVLLLSKFNKAASLKLSFLLSLPIVLAGNILMHAQEFSFSGSKLIGLASSFIFGLITIHLLLKVAEKINFGYFVLLFAALTIASVFV